MSVINVTEDNLLSVLATNKELEYTQSRTEAMEIWS